MSVLRSVPEGNYHNIFEMQAMGGRFRSLLPSDLFKAGALAVESLPATRGPEYATVSNRGELFRLMRRSAL